MGVVHYHFGNKHLILEATIDRKLAVLHERIDVSFKGAKDSKQRMKLEDTVAAFILPFLRAASDPNDPLRNYIVMTSHLMSSYRLPELRPILAKLSSISGLFTNYLQKSQPEILERDLLAGVYFIEAALIFMVQDPGFLDDLSHEHHSTSRLEEMAGPALRFFACGLLGLKR
ncbi:MAG: TetR/AcrR family transcriptional regulator [Novosphingobium lindaniclasticum]|nr:TetR/AcrR family transcriptional regulator [Novosphingobium lindaniclasticum]